MPTLATAPETRAYQKAQVALRAVVYSDVAAIWSLLRYEELDASFTRFTAAAIALIEARRTKSADLARAYLLARRRGVSGAPPAITTPTLNRQAALISLRVVVLAGLKSATAAGTKREMALRNTLVRTMGVVDKYVGDAGRELIRQSVAADPAARGWIRRTLGTCDYCENLAAEEHVEDGTADFPRHDHCGCQPEPVYENALKPEEQYVQKIAGMLERGEVTEEQLRAALLDPNMKPLSRVNIETALIRIANQRAVVEARLAAAAAERLSAEALLSQTQYDALSPASAWSEEKRMEILTALRETPEGRILADTLERFQDGGSIARLRTKIEQYLAGVEIDATSKARVEALLNAIQYAPDWAPETLYRGMTVKGKLENVLAKYEVGGTLDLNLTSFSSDRAVAQRFASMTAKGAGNETRVMVQLVGEGKRTIPIQNLPADKRLFKEKEWVSAGRYEVVEAKKSPGGGIILKIRQVGSP